MNMDGINKWLTLLANIGVIAGIVFLGLEVRQNTEATYSQSRETVLISSQNELFEMMNNSEVMTNVVRSEDLTRDEQYKINSFLLAFLRVREYSWLQYQNTIIDEDQWKTELVVIGNVLSAHRTRKWWVVTGRYQFNPNFSEFLDDYLMAIPISDDNWLAQMTWENM